MTNRDIHFCRDVCMFVCSLLEIGGVHVEAGQHIDGRTDRKTDRMPDIQRGRKAKRFKNRLMSR